MKMKRKKSTINMILAVNVCASHFSKFRKVVHYLASLKIRRRRIPRITVKEEVILGLSRVWLIVISTREVMTRMASNQL